MKLKIYQVDSFTKAKFKGNPACVMVNADGLSDKQMQLISRELNNSETAFLLSADDNNCDAVIRYFTPKMEVPTCGHATIAAMYVKALEEDLDSCIIRLKTRIGILPCEILRENGDYKVTMTQGRFELTPEFDPETTRKLLLALGLEKSDLEDKCPIQIASTGHSKVMIGINNRKKLNDLDPDFYALAKLSELIKCNGYFVFTFDSGNSKILTNGRMFAPAIWINEDPVTGNANGPLGGYLVQNKIVKYSDNIFEFTGRQGVKMGRVGEINVKVKVENNFPAIIQIKGEAVVVFKTEIEI